MKKTFTILIFVISSITISAQNEAHNIDTMQSENLRKNIASGYFDNEIYKPDNNTLNDRNTPIDEDSYRFYVGLNVGYQFLLKE